MQQRSLPPTRDWRQVAPGSPATPNRHFNAALLREGSPAGNRRRTPHTHTGPPLGFSKQDQQDSALRTTRGRCLEAVATRGRNIATHTSRCLAPPHIPEPPARPTASRRSGRRHAVLRRCAEATQAASYNWNARSLRAPRLRPPNRLPARPPHEEAVGGMRCCGGVLRQCARQDHDAER